MRGALVSFLLLFAVLLALPLRLRGDSRDVEVRSFIVEQEIVLPATPTEVYDAVTGGISGWWDHHFSPNPKKLYVEAKSGGCFCEIFNDAGDGAIAATVIYAERGKRLRLSGPFGLSGHAATMVVTYDLSPEGTGRRLHLTVSTVGETPPLGAREVDDVWHHFLFERLKP